MPLRPFLIGWSLVCLAATALSQELETGATDYALGNSSVMWLPRSTSLFQNPGELARLHQNEFYLSSGRFRDFNSMSSAFFLPRLGTVGLGVSPSGDSTKYSLGYGTLIGEYHDIGTAISVIPRVKAGLRFAFGGAIHLPTSVQNSGFHLGAAVTNLPQKAVINGGAAFWIVPDIARIQAATRSDVVRAEFLGVDVRILGGLGLQAGTRGFKKVLGGLTYETSYVVAAVGAGPEGISFGMNFRFGEAAAEVHDAARDDGEEAFKDGRYSEARESYLTAVRYDEYDDASRELASRCSTLTDSLVTVLLEKAHQDEAGRNFSGAMKSYAQIMRMDPRQSSAATDLANVQQKFRQYIQQLLATGDSLRDRHQIDEARKSYAVVLELEPNNDSATVRVGQLNALAKQNVRLTLSRAESLLRKDRLDDAEGEFRKVLADDPKNESARSGLRTIASRRLSAEIGRVRSVFKNKQYFDALQMLLDMIGRGEENREIKDLLEKTRNALKSETDRLFKLGLQFYIKEDFNSAIAEWDKVLMIAPSDSSTLEYKKRAEEKLKALEQYQ